MPTYIGGALAGLERLLFDGLSDDRLLAYGVPSNGWAMFAGPPKIVS